METVETARRAIPLVPASEAECVTRLMGVLGLPGRDDARAWVTFLRALDLITETDRGFARRRTDVDRAVMFRVRVYGVAELVDALETPATVEEAFDAVPVPTWERHKAPGTWEATWRDRVERLLEWGVLFGVFERDGDRFRAETI